MNIELSKVMFSDKNEILIEMEAPSEKGWEAKKRF